MLIIRVVVGVHGGTGRVCGVALSFVFWLELLEQGC